VTLADLLAVTPAVPLHLGALHPYERLLVLLVAFGPFVALAFVVRSQRRRAIAEEEAAARQRR
jgi:hypothetical protein